MIINLLALLTILVTGAVAGVLLTIRYYERRHDELGSVEDQLAIRDLLASWSTARTDSPDPRETSALESPDRLAI